MKKYDYAWRDDKNCYAVFDVACAAVATALCASATDAERVKAALNRTGDNFGDSEHVIETEVERIPPTRKLFAL